MMPPDLKAHLTGGHTTLSRCWHVLRRDSQGFGFTDHDCDLSFENITFRADSGMTAKAFEQSTGLSIDNSEAAGALSSAHISEADLRAGLFDGAEVRCWLVNWADVAQRQLQFRGTLGEVGWAAGAFRAELRGLTEQLNQPMGRVFQRGCGAVLGDQACGFDLNSDGYFVELAAENVSDGKRFSFAGLTGFDDRWFERGTLRVLSGAARGLSAVIKLDRLGAAGREVELWQSLRAKIAAGDMVRLQAGCDKASETCRLKFNNFMSFQGFPDIPGEDWLMTYPASGGTNDGGSLR